MLVVEVVMLPPPVSLVVVVVVLDAIALSGVVVVVVSVVAVLDVSLVVSLWPQAATPSDATAAPASRILRMDVIWFLVP